MANAHLVAYWPLDEGTGTTVADKTGSWDGTITGNIGAVWAHQDISIASNDAEPMYVAIANSTGQPAVVYHDNPDATTIDTWTEWNIDLKDFADKGINLADVNSIAIGFGDRNNPVTGGAGKMYFDDIRLYRPRCVPDKVTPSAADLNADCIVDMADVETMVGDWLAGDRALAADYTRTARLTSRVILSWKRRGSMSVCGRNGR